MDSQTYGNRDIKTGQMDGQMDGQTDRWANKQMKDIDRQADRQTIRQTDRQMDRQIIRQSDGQSDRLIDRAPHRHTGSLAGGQIGAVAVLEPSSMLDDYVSGLPLCYLLLQFSSIKC
jgi:hypothetical protein